MPSLEYPRLRLLRPYRVEHRGETYAAFEDTLGVADPTVLLPIEWVRLLLRHFDGRTPLSEIRERVRREAGGLLAGEHLNRTIEQLDRARILDGPTFAAYRASYRREPERPAAFAGRSYAATAATLQREISRLFDHERGAGRPEPAATLARAGALRGILAPHIDFSRGGPTYTWAYRALAERSDADLFVVLGVAHQACEHRFALTCKDFRTPLGLARTDRAFVERLADRAGAHLFDDELVHRAEHSIEFQVVFLQYVLGLGPARPFAIVPILVGSFHDLMESGLDPMAADPGIARFVAALQETEQASGRRVAYIGGIDMSHVGREFGDPDLLDDSTLDRLRASDQAMLQDAMRGDAASWFARAARVRNRWRVCGLAATYTFLHAIGPARGRLLRYEQAVNRERTCGVSFAGAAFDADGASA
jgi:AmmeMemoRadiSam system protein B